MLMFRVSSSIIISLSVAFHVLFYSLFKLITRCDRSDQFASTKHLENSI